MRKYRNQQHNTAFKKSEDATRTEQKDKTTSCFVSRPQTVLLWSGLLQILAGGVLWSWRGQQVSKDLLLWTLFVPLVNGPKAQSNHKTRPMASIKQSSSCSTQIDACFFFFFWGYLSKFHLQLWVYKSHSCSTSEAGIYPLKGINWLLWQQIMNLNSSLRCELSYDIYFYSFMTLLC